MNCKENKAPEQSGKKEGQEPNKSDPIAERGVSQS